MTIFEQCTKPTSIETKRILLMGKPQKVLSDGCTEEWGEVADSTKMKFHDALYFIIVTFRYDRKAAACCLAYDTSSPDPSMDNICEKKLSVRGATCCRSREGRSSANVFPPFRQQPKDTVSGCHSWGVNAACYYYRCHNTQKKGSNLFLSFSSS